MKLPFFIAVNLSLSVIAGCASTPHVTAHYYFPKAETQVTITQTLGCGSNVQDPRNKDVKTPVLISAATVAATTTYSSDRGMTQGTLNYSDLDGPFSDTDTAVSFTDDGRLAGLNATSTGQGVAIIKNVLTFAATVLPADYPGFTAAQQSSVDRACAIIANHTISKPADPGKAAANIFTLTYSTNFVYVKNPAYPKAASDLLLIAADPTNSVGAEPGAHSMLAINPDAASASVYKELKALFPALEFTVAISPNAQILAPATWDGLGLTVKLELNRVAVADLAVAGPSDNLLKKGIIWKGEASVPVPGSTEHYWLPIPKATFFGKQQFALSLSGYGSVTKLEYGKNTGLSDATDVANALTRSVESPSINAQAAALQAQSDLIYQQQRLVTCKLTPNSCPAK